MTPPQKKSNFSLLKGSLIGASSTALLVLDGWGFWNLLAPQIFSNSVATAIPQNSVSKKLIGQWQGEISGRLLTLIFTPEGKLFILQTSTSAIEFEYRTDVTRQPKYLDLLVGGQIATNTIFDFTADGKLRLEFYDIKKSRPTSFSSNATVFNKISEQTTLPANVTVINNQDIQAQANKAKQAEAKQYVSSMNRGQQAFYAEQGRFASTLEEFQKGGILGLKSETENYSYRIVLSNNKRFVQSIALPKIDGLRNYTGIVYLVKSAGGEQTTSSILCQSHQPSKKLPGAPVVNNSTSNLQCPVGYSQIN
ncbi:MULTISPECIES: type IV pilin-like G/H family protein [unclassified Microcoleus]|uniref:type IV pilin-like G/H family protein n=1 Tax=unclassified Microcoleus TaxID=2642155 RepID=UPI002FD233BD